MKPVRLVIQAFGPYREREVVDFTKLGPNRVFLIHGDTGAGKTTILDAMVFALYGDTSGGERRADQMRCGSAAAGLPTEVVFDFSLGERSFRIRRRPAQDLLGARANSVVSKPAEVALWDRTGCDESEEGRPLATKIREADVRINALLGFSCEQFRQVVVLPQGRFRELLSSGSDKREEILRQLFRTERFKELEIALQERAKAVRRQMDELKAQRAAQLNVAGAADDAELAALVGEAEDRVRSSARDVEERSTAEGKAAKALSTAVAADSARQAVVAARADLESLAVRSGEVEVLRVCLADATRAEKLRPAALKMQDAAVRRQEAAAAVAQAGQRLAEGLEAERQAVARLVFEKGRLSEREATSDQVRRLEGLLGATAALRDAQKECDEVLAGRVSADEAAAKAQEERGQAEAALRQIRERLEAGRLAASQIEAARSRLRQVEEAESRCRRYLDACAAEAHASEARATCEAAEATALSAYNEAQAKADEIERRWKAGRASSLAAALEPGRPCPVCGSTEHPSPATVLGEGADDRTLDEARSAAAEAHDLYDQAREESARARGDLAAARTLERSIREEPGPGTELSIVEAEAAVAAGRIEVERLLEQADAMNLAVEATECEQALEAAATVATAAIDDAARARDVWARAEERLKARVDAVPEELREEGALEAALESARVRKGELEAALDAAEESERTATQARIALETAATGAAETEHKALQTERVCLEEFQAMLPTHRFADEDEWHGCLLDEERRTALAREIEEFQAQLQLAHGRLQQAEAALAGLPEPGDLERLRAEAEKAKLEQTQAIERHSEAKSLLDTLAGVADRLARIDAQAADVRAVYQTVGVLAEVAGGQNPSRVSFQRWVLGVYLDEVLAVASRRLYLMSKGRYRLERQRELASHGRPSGLDLAVFDEFSGTSRAAVTLSGGESFLAALALALGLAETVQEHSAATPLETIFVDEGFGALDTDALELAVDALMELQMSGRLVGVISHVAELRQVIPARLEVRGGSGGSSTRFIVP